jgi:hypothetical protein
MGNIQKHNTCYHSRCCENLRIQKTLHQDGMYTSLTLGSKLGGLMLATEEEQEITACCTVSDIN